MNPNTLFPHNLHAYNEIMSAFGEGKRKVCVEHATATGKSYLITAVSDHFERVVIIIPGEEVREQVRDTVIKLSPERSLMPDFITYQKLTEDNKAGLMESDYKNKYDLIVIDEYHHTGAKEWGKAIQALIDNNADAKVLGTTATPERYSEGGRNMSEEFFDGNVASRLDLGTAWKRKVLMAADYIIAIEDSEKFHDEFIREIEESKLMDEDKSSFKDMVKQLQHDYDLKGKEPGVVKNHLRPEAKRVIVFSKTISQAKKDERKVKGWLKQAGFKIAGSYVIDSNVGSAERERIRNAFQSNDFEGIKVMVAVNMLNEGVHVPDVDAVFFLRKTMSPTIHLQQMGRCMKLYKEDDHRPVVFDFCNNIKNVVKDDIAQLFKSERQSFDAWQDLEQSEPTVVEKKPRKTKEAEDENFPRGINYSASDYDLYEAFTRDLSNADWDKNYAEAKAFYEVHGYFPADNENKKIRRWVVKWWKRIYLKNTELHQEKADMLKSIGFIYKSVENRYDEMWFKNYEKSKAFFVTHGHFPTCGEDERLAEWVRAWWKNTYLKNTELHQEKADMLKSIGFIYKSVEDRYDEMWLKNYTEAKTFYDEHGHFPTQKENKILYEWAKEWWSGTYCNNRIKHQNKAEMLTKIGYVYPSIVDLHDKLWLKNYKKVKDFYDKYGRWPLHKEIPKIGDWAMNWWRKTYQNNPKLHQEKADMLTAIGFVYQVAEDRYDGMFMKNYAEAKTFYDEHGYFPTQKENSSLIAWANNWVKKSSYKFPEKLALLKSIGYKDRITIKEYRNHRWHNQFIKAKLFFEEYGRFPKYSEERLIYAWAKQWWKNTYLKNTELHQEKADMLIAIGFEYKGKK